MRTFNFNCPGCEKENKVNLNGVHYVIPKTKIFDCKACESRSILAVKKSAKLKDKIEVKLNKFIASAALIEAMVESQSEEVVQEEVK